jgi:hypothetical protein
MDKNCAKQGLASGIQKYKELGESKERKRHEIYQIDNSDL